MIARSIVVVALLALGAFILWHPAPRPALVASASLANAQPSFAPMGERPRRVAPAANDDVVVYVAGAVRRPGLYHVRAGDRVANAVALAGGLRAAADAAGVNLAQRAQDGDEIDVPVVGELPSSHRSRGAKGAHRRGRHHGATPAAESVDVNRADAAQLALVPGIGRAVAARIVDLRAREGSFTTLDELLDVAGMTSARLERARPYLQAP